MDQNDDKKAVQSEVEETTQEASPSSEAPITTEQTAPTEPESKDGATEETQGEPKGMTEEQRKAFQEQRLEIKRLKEESEARKQTESAFAPFRPQAQPGIVDVTRFTDPTTGYVDWNGYNTAVSQHARSEAAQAAREQLDEYQARQSHPELFTDPATERLIAAQWLYDKMQGKDASITAIANDFAKNFSKAVAKAEKSGAEKMLTQVSEKERAAVTPSQTSSKAQQAVSADELEQLRQQSRGRGSESDEAVAKRMKQIPWR